MRTAAVIKRILKQMLRDKRTLALLLVAPLFMMSLMYFLFNSSSEHEYILGVSGVDKTVVSALNDSNITTVDYTSSDSSNYPTDKPADGYLSFKTGSYELTLQNDDPSVSSALKMKINSVLTKMAVGKLTGGASFTAPEIHATYVYGSSDTTFFDIFSSVLVGFFVFFFVFLISGIGLLRERTTGTLERLITTPIKRREIIAGYLIGYGIFAVVQTLVVIIFAAAVLKIMIVGSVWLVVLINLLLAFVALSLGILLSTFAASEFQMIQFIPIVIIPQIFFAGIFPVESMPGWLQVIARFMPIYYGADALKSVMYRGLGFSDIAADLGMLLLFTAVFILLNVLALKKNRKG